MLQTFITGRRHELPHGLHRGHFEFEGGKLRHRAGRSPQEQADCRKNNPRNRNHHRPRRRTGQLRNVQGLFFLRFLR